MLTNFEFKVFVDSQLDVTDKHTFSYQNIHLPELLFHTALSTRIQSIFAINVWEIIWLRKFLIHILFFQTNYLLVLLVRIHYLENLTRKNYIEDKRTFSLI